MGGTAEQMLVLGVERASILHIYDSPEVLILDTIAPPLDKDLLGRALGVPVLTQEDCGGSCYREPPPVSAFLELQYMHRRADTVFVVMDYVSRPPPHGPKLYALGDEIGLRERPDGTWELVSVRRAWEY